MAIELGLQFVELAWLFMAMRAFVTERSSESLGRGPEGTDKKTTALKEAEIEVKKVGTLGSSTAPAGSKKKKKKKRKKRRGR